MEMLCVVGMNSALRGLCVASLLILGVQGEILTH